MADWKSGRWPALWNIYGLDGTTAGQALAVSADGTIIFGISPLVVGGATNNYGYKAVFNATYPGPATQLSTNQLPNFPDTAGSANLAIPYGCTADGKYAVGANYRGGIEKAVLWDTQRFQPGPNWTVIDLTDLAVASGASGIFARLARAYQHRHQCGGKSGHHGGRLGHQQPGQDAGVSDDRFSADNSRHIPRHGDYLWLIPGRLYASVSLPSPMGMSCIIWSARQTCRRWRGWTAIASTPGTGAPAGLSDHNPPDRQRFYRIRVQ